MKMNETKTLSIIENCFSPTQNWYVRYVLLTYFMIHIVHLNVLLSGFEGYTKST